MKNYNRRDFLKLTGLTALALTFSACGSSTPAVPSQDAQSLFAAINAHRKDKGLKELKYDNDLEAYVKLDAECFEAQGKAKIAPAVYGNWMTVSHSTDYVGLRSKLYTKHINGSVCTYYGLASTETDITLTVLCPATDDELHAQLDAMAASIGNTMDYIGITLTTIGGKKYWVAMLATTLD